MPILGQTQHLQTTRAPTKFALYVKEHYGTTKREMSGKPHKEVMKVLSERFKQRDAVEKRTEIVLD